jgi:hypothetical protein
VVFVGPLARVLSLALRLFGMDKKRARVVAALVTPSVLGGIVLGILYGALPTLALMFILRGIGVWGRTAFIVVLCLWLGGGSVAGAILLARGALDGVRRR